jgi:hypothetical protein
MYKIGKKIDRINANDARSDTPIELKELIRVCTDPDIQYRSYDFSQVNLL